MRPKTDYSEKAGWFAKLAALAIIVGTVWMVVYSYRVATNSETALGAWAQQGVVVADTLQIDPANDGRMVYLETIVEPDGDIFDPLFNIGGHYCNLWREVAYYQWIPMSKETTRALTSTEKELLEDISPKHLTREQKEELRSGRKKTTEEYWEKGWYGDTFEGKGAYTNVPPPFTLESVYLHAPTYRAGAYWLNHELGIPERITDMRYVSLSDISIEQVRRAIGPRANGLDIHIAGDTAIYIGQDPANPQLGDIKIEFRADKPERMYILAQANGDSLQPAPIEGVDRKYYVMSYKPFDPDEELKGDSEAFNSMRWVIGILAWLLFVWAAHLLKASIADPMRRIPLLGKAIPKKPGKGTMWLIGTLLAIVVIGLCLLLF